MVLCAVEEVGVGGNYYVAIKNDATFIAVNGHVILFVGSSYIAIIVNFACVVFFFLRCSHGNV